MWISEPNELFARIWTRWALGFFLVASILGLAMRAFYVVEIPMLEYRNILHAHSHIALLGWGFMMLMGAMIFALEDSVSYANKYGWLFIALLVAIVGMLLSFPVQGYGAVSISFSTLFILLSYVFVAKFWRTLRQKTNTLGVRLIRWALMSYLISTLGLWSLGPITAILGRMHELYFMAIQWFLHFQLNGWFVLGVLGVCVLFVEKRGVSIVLYRIPEALLLASVVLSYALVITWADPSPLFFWINSFAVLIQAVIYTILLQKTWKGFVKLQIYSFALWLLRLALLSLASKALLQLLLVVPAVAVISYTIRMYVVGFLHLALLGGMSLGIAGLAMAERRFPSSFSSRLGWLLISIAFVGTEILLFGQGTMVWLQWGYLNWYHIGLFVLSILFPLGLSIALFSLFTVNYSTPFPPIPSKILNQNQSQTMKKLMIWSLGIVVMLVTSCGGGETQSSASSAESPAAEAKTADPKGIGEIKNVEIGADIDATLADKGKAIVDMKCTACHQLNDKRLVGPGFQGVTNRRRPEWIMNMITNVDVMLDQDPTAQALLEECLTRMPNQNISTDDARGILEFLRRNDEEKAGQRDAAGK
jgi:mono/diheme cytochrome c family protein